MILFILSMNIQLVGVTKPIIKRGECDSLFVDYDKIENVLDESSDKENIIKSIKRFTQNFARVCYSKYDWNELLKEEFNEKLIDERVIPSKHHSVFEHIWLNFYLEGIPKIGAMILNNEKQYVTSEKSARYTQMIEVEPVQKELYNKWMEILIPEIDKIYPQLSDLKARTETITKLAQENARYMTSVFTPTNMAYTANLRQLNFLLRQFERDSVPNISIGLEERVVPMLNEFAGKIDSLRILGLEYKDDDKGISLFDNRDVEEHFGDVYSTRYLMSFASLAQAQRHRTINYHISDRIDLDSPFGFFIPKIVSSAKLDSEWISDLEEVAKSDFPQARLLCVNERGIIEHFRGKAIERICGQAQYETMRNTVETAEKFNQYQKEYGENSCKPKCLQGKKCNFPCVWGGEKATTRLI